MPTALYRESADIPGPHNRGALHSGDTTIGTDGVAVLAKRVSIDASRGGAFTEPIFIPPWSLVTAIIFATTATFNQAATVSIGTVVGNEVLAATPLNGTNPVQYFSPSTAASYMETGKLTLTYAPVAATQGSALIVVQYVRI